MIAYIFFICTRLSVWEFSPNPFMCIAMRLCYISRNYKAPSSGGGKAKSDIEQTLASMGAINIGLTRTTCSSKTYDFFRTLGSVVKALWNVRHGDVVVLQYPVKKYFTLICRTAHRRGAKIIAIIHDLGAFRRRRLTIREEITRLNHADIVIAANDHQHKWLQEKGCQAMMAVYGLHDYLTTINLPANHTAPPYTPLGKPHFSLYFVGDLTPRNNRYLYTLGRQMQHTEIFLYGKGFDRSAAGDESTLRWIGFTKDTDLITTHRGDFGLCWYGESCETAAGHQGEYMAINTPHKLSLYLRCGTPIIIWRHAAMAAVIEQEGLGIVVDTLGEVERRLEQLTLAEYHTMQQHVQRVAQALAEGQSCRRAVTKAYHMLSGVMDKCD